jgi:glycine/D-amino acid oxidase-like deaminating enzyme
MAKRRRGLIVAAALAAGLVGLLLTLGRRRQEEPPRPVVKMSLLRRWSETLRLLLGLRPHDFRAAGTLVASMFPGRLFFVRWLRFVGWAANQMLWVIPDALVETTFADPLSRTSIWLDETNPLQNHPWRDDPAAALPPEVDVLVIGAGFTGAACAYHWAKQQPEEKQMAVLEMADPAEGASGACAGLVVMGRYFALVQRTVRRHLEKTRRDLTPTQRDQLAHQFAAVYAQGAYKNAAMVEETVRAEGFDCGYVRRGWIQAVDREDQDALQAGIAVGQAVGYADRESLAPDAVLEEGGMRVDAPAAYSPGAATFHPARWVWSLLQRALRQPGVQLFTRTEVLEVIDAGDLYVVRTNRGVVTARHIINATESFTGRLHPEWQALITPVQTQGAFASGGPASMPPGIALSSTRGFFLRPTDSAGVLFGSDETHLAPLQAGRNQPSRFITKFVLGEMTRYLGVSRQRVTHEWSATAGFTLDEYPVVGLLDGKRQYVIGGMCGSGTGVSFNAARHVVQQILGLDGPDDYPATYFAPSRLLDPENHPWPPVEGE